LKSSGSWVNDYILICYLEGNIPENSVPAAVMVEFPNYTGPSFVKDNPKLVPILHAKSGSTKSFPADFALESATNKAPGLRDSKALVPGLMTIY
jgi:hypothetical protein